MAIKVLHKLLSILARLISLDLFAMVMLSNLYQCQRKEEN